jgi:hypothetical protein
MKTRTKTILIITTTLIIGMIVGSVLTGTILRSYRLRDRIEHMRTPEGFVSRFERIIKPDEQQRDKVHEILLEHFGRMESTSSRFFDQMKTLQDTLNMQLEPILTPEQKKRWHRFHERFKDRKFPHPRRPRSKRKGRADADI